MDTVKMGNYKNEEAMVLENNKVRVKVIPHRGSKIASIVYKPLNHEILWQLQSEQYRDSTYGCSYIDAECSGFDEMFPSINQCYYQRYPWAGTEIPDHGEVWSIPWEYETAGDELRMWVFGVRLPYRLDKTVTLKGQRIEIRYRAENLSSFDMDFLWAAHPLFQASTQMEFIVPDNMNKILNAYDAPQLRQYGRVYDFPRAVLPDDGELNLAFMPEAHKNVHAKYFFLGRVSEGWCMLYDRLHTLNIGLSYPEKKVPYLGMWIHAGGLLDGHYNIAPEPATAAMDGIDRARSWGMNSVLGPRETYEWHLNISLKAGEKQAGVDAKGGFWST